jgi:hypothetical protein
MRRLLGYLLFIAIAALAVWSWCSAYARAFQQPQVGRYQIEITTDGTLVLDTATGEVRLVDVGSDIQSRPQDDKNAPKRF